MSKKLAINLNLKIYSINNCMPTLCLVLNARVDEVLEKTLESPLKNKEIKTISPEENQPWMFTGRTDAEAETPTLCPLDAKNWLLRKDPDAGKDWRQEEKGTTEDEMDGWHHWWDDHDFEQALVVGVGQGSLMSCSPWGCKESDTAEWLNWTPFLIPVSL